MSLSLRPEECIYTSCYCEENVWHICNNVKVNHPILLEECFAVFISNNKEAIPLWSQKQGKDEEGLVIWDYHVVFIHKTKEKTLVYDFDTRLPFPSSFETYSKKTLGSDDNLLPEFQRFFRVVPAGEYLATFASDRSHMLKDGKWLKPPPNYPPICTANSQHNLGAFISMTSQQFPGRIFNCREFISQFS